MSLIGFDFIENGIFDPCDDLIFDRFDSASPRQITVSQSEDILEDTWLAVQPYSCRDTRSAYLSRFKTNKGVR